MKRFGIGCLAALIFVLVSYAGWVSYPPSRYESWAVQIVERASRDFETAQKAARDPQQNGFLTPEMVAYWGRKGQEYREGAPPTAEVEAVLTWSDPAKGEPTGLDSQFRKASVQKAFSDFEKLTPTLQEAFLKPYFVAPDSRPPSWDTVVPNLIALRKLAQATSAYSHFLLLSGRVDSAILVQLPLLRLTQALSRPPSSLLSTMIAIACGDISRHGLLLLLQSAGERVSTPVLVELSTTLEATQMPSDQLFLALEDEFFSLHNTAQALRKGGYASLTPATRTALSLAPGLAEREVRLMKNEYLGSLDHFKNDSEADYLQYMTRAQSQASGIGWFLGQSSPMTNLALTNFSGAAQNCRLARARHAYLHLLVGLLLHRRQHPSWPFSLEELQKAGYKPLDGLELSRVQLSRVGSNCRLSYSPPDPEAQKLKINPPTPGMERWNVLSAPDWKVQLNAPPR